MDDYTDRDLWTGIPPAFADELGIQTELELTPGLIVAMGVCFGFLAWLASIVIITVTVGWPIAAIDLAGGLVVICALYAACGREDW